MTASQFLKELPKCEHHTHLEGTLSPELLFKLAEINNVTLPKDFPASAELLQERYNRFSGLQDFLDHYYIGMSVLVTEQDFESLAWEYFVKAHQDGVWHTEVFFDPQAHVERNIDLSLIVSGFTKARLRAEKELGISTKLIMCLLRHLEPEPCVDAMKLAQKHFEDGHIHGVGLDSSEVGRRPALFTEAYNIARSFNVPVNFTAHAGEEGGPDYVVEAIDELGVERIDHGVRSAEDDELLKRLAANQTLLSVCPLSNLMLRVVKDVSELPLKKFLEYGVPFSLNGDDPAYFGGYCLKNYEIVHEKFDFDIDTWCKIAKAGIAGSWVDDQRKAEMLLAVDNVKSKYQGTF